MNKLVILFVTAVTAITLTGCWSATTETNSETNAETANANLTPDANYPETANFDVNVVNNPPEGTQNVEQKPLMEVQTNKVGNHVRTGKPGIDPPGMKEAEKRQQYKLGNESSLISNVMNKEGHPVQTRKFGGNPQIDKVEIISIDAKQRKILVYLKNGKTLQMAEGKLADPMTASSYQILKAVDVEVIPAPMINTKKKEAQK